jgi:hypothetical protein
MKPNIDKLEVGMKFKSFKQLVEFVELEYREGGYAVMLLKNKLAKYIEFEYDINVKTGRKKQSLTITKIIK